MISQPPYSIYLRALQSPPTCQVELLVYLKGGPHTFYCHSGLSREQGTGCIGTPQCPVVSSQGLRLIPWGTVRVTNAAFVRGFATPAGSTTAETRSKERAARTGERTTPATSQRSAGNAAALGPSPRATPDASAAPRSHPRRQPEAACTGL